MTNRTRRSWRLAFWISLASLLISGWFGYRVAEESRSHGALVGVLSSLAIATPIILFELQGQKLSLARRLRRLPLPLYFATRVAFYVLVIVLGLSIVRLALDGRGFAVSDIFQGGGFAFSIAMAVIVNLAIEVGHLLGFGTLANVVSGRYARPRREERIFLLIDMKGSTGLAERLGPLRFHDLLNDFFRDVADGALECGAEIHKYVGDEAILTWRIGSRPIDEDVLACPFIIRDHIAVHAADYRRLYQATPAFRAALHCGEVVTGQIGDVRREIAFVGDTLNVAARLLEAARTTGEDVLVSADLLGRAPLSPKVSAQPLPTLDVRGREANVGIAALHRS